MILGTFNRVYFQNITTKLTRTSTLRLRFAEFTITVDITNVLKITEYNTYFSKIFLSHWVILYFISLKSVIDFIAGHAVIRLACVSLASPAFVIACRNRIASVLIDYWPTGVIYPFLRTVSSAVAT
jgi:hypothetical protein